MYCKNPKLIYYYAFGFCSLPCLFVYLRMRMSTSKQHSCGRGPLRECRPIRSGASRLPYYCAPLVCVSQGEVIELLAVWRDNKPKTKNQLETQKTKHRTALMVTKTKTNQNQCCPTSIAGVLFDSVRRFRATLLLRTTCIRLWGNWVASCVVALQTKNQKNLGLSFKQDTCVGSPQSLLRELKWLTQEFWRAPTWNWSRSSPSVTRKISKITF